MIPPDQPANEPERLRALHSYQILDTLPEADYDSITRLAAFICGTPTALISLVDADRQWFKSVQNFEASETSRDIAFCAYNILSPGEPLIVEDARTDQRFNANPLVTADPNIVFYAGVPIVDPDGYALGSLCVLDQKPRILSAEQRQALQDLTRQIVNLLQLRRSNAALQETIVTKTADQAAMTATQSALQESERRFRNLVEQALNPVCVFRGENLVLDIANQPVLDVWQTDRSSIGKPLIEILPELRDQPIIPWLLDVYHKGTTLHLSEISVRLERKNGSVYNGFFDFVYQPYRETDGTVTGVMATANDVTEQVHARQQIQRSEARFRTLIEQAPVATCLYTGKGKNIVELANSKMLKIWDKDRSVVGKPMLEGLPELEGQPFPEILNSIYDTSRPYTGVGMPAQLKVDGVLDTFYFDFGYQPLFDDTGRVSAIMAMALDVTDRVKSRQKIEESEARLRTTITSAPVAICIFIGEEMVVTMPNDAFIEVVGKGADIVGKPLSVVMPELAGEGQPFLDILKDVYQNGTVFKNDAALARIVRNGVLTDNYFNITFSPLRDGEGKIYGILDISIDVTALILAQRELLEAQSDLRGAIEVANLGTFDVDVAAGSITVSRRTADWFGYDGLTHPVEKFIEGVGENERDYVSNSLSKAIKAGGDGRYDVVHSIINAKDGSKTIIHALSQVSFDETGRATHVKGIAQDITSYHDMQATLEIEVQQRTEELHKINEELTRSNERITRSNEELEQYAYVASHDLQEPLRKIQVFTGLLGKEKGISDNSIKLLDKLSASAQRMRTLIDDLLEFSRLLDSERPYSYTDLNYVVDNVVKDFELLAAETGATIDVGPLPTIEAVSLQINQLFHNLVGNALKFTRPGVVPVIHVMAEAMDSALLSRYILNPLPSVTYYRICVQDNGIGIEPERVDQIFELFRRLHSSEAFPGSGIGLALCRRIAANHHGAIYAEPTPEGGSRFCIILPSRQ